MDFTEDEKILAVKETVRGIKKKFEGKEDEIFKKILERKFPQELWDEFVRAGLLGAIVPEEYGGNGAGMMAVTVAVEELVANLLANALLALTIVAESCVLRNGTEEQKKRFLPLMAQGKIKCALGVTEAEAGTNTFRIKTLARKKGDRYIITGSKIYITGADVADWILLVARTTPYEEVVKKGLPKTFGLAVFLVDLSSPGVEVRVMRTRGIEGMNQCTVFFDEVEVPEENLLGQPDAGAFVLFNGLNPERILTASSCIGMARFALSKAVEYAKERVVFGSRPIGSYQAIQHPLAEVKILEEACRLLTLKSAWAWDKGFDPATVGNLANMAKYLSAELALKAVDSAIETLGGAGFVEDNRLMLLWEMARLFKVAPVSREMILNFIAEHVLGLPRSY